MSAWVPLYSLLSLEKEGDSISTLGQILSVLLQIYYYLLIARIILSWFQGAFYDSPGMASIYRMLHGLTEPLLAPLRQVLPAVRLGMGYLDLSPLVMLLLLILARGFVIQYLI